MTANDKGHNISRGRKLTAEEAAKYRKVREQVMEEIPPAGDGTERWAAIFACDLLKQLEMPRRWPHTKVEGYHDSRAKSCWQTAPAADAQGSGRSRTEP